MNICLYKDTFSKEFLVIPFQQMMDAILTGTYRESIDYLRTLDAAGYKAQKKLLPAVTWSGTFKTGTRLIESLESYSGLVVLDIDKLDPSNIEVLKQQLSMDPFVHFCFVSPSGNGIKIVVRVNTGPEHHLSAFLHLQKTFEDKYLFKVDPSGKDVCRLCYVSYDERCIWKHSSEIFEVDTRYGEIAVYQPNDNLKNYQPTTDLDNVFKVCTKWVNNTKTYQDGEKNVYIHAMACALNRCGVAMEDAINLITMNLPTPDIKWHQSVKSAYFLNQHEHGAVTIRDLNSGTNTFIAPPYVANYTDDVATNDLMRITAELFYNKVNPTTIQDIIGKITRYYNKEGYVDLDRASLADLMNRAIYMLQQQMANHASKSALSYETAESLGIELINQDAFGSLPTYLPWIDEPLGGGLMNANFYGLIGFGGTFKSVIVQFWTFMHSCNDIPVLYLNGEMSKLQFYERLALQVFGINLRYEMSKGNINKENIASFIEQMETVTKKNIFFFNGSGFNKASINATLDHILATTGKKVKLIIMDGLTQMDQGGREEAPANIHNSGICKEIVKEAHGGEGVTLVALIHCSGAENKTLRNTGTVVRGGSKMLANMDGFFCTSLLVDPETMNMENTDDMSFLPGKFYFRMVDKRSTAGTVSCIVNVTPKLLLEMEECDPKQYELNPSKRNN
jgi:hypothetical protein